MTACPQCGSDVPSAALACPSCHRLVHGETVQQLVNEATSHARAGRYDASLEAWRKALVLLPPDTQQALWVSDQISRLRELPAAASRPDTRGGGSQRGSNWLGRLGPVGVVIATILKGKTLISLLANAKFLLSFGAFLGVYWSLYGAAFGIGFAVSILIHEMGHYLEVRRRGLPADMPVFLPGLGAYVRWAALGVPLRARAMIALAGPFAGALAAAVCLLAWQVTGRNLWAALAHTGAWLNLINLLPVTMLDGGHAMYALDRRDRIMIVAASVLGFALLGEGVYLIVAAGALWRVFSDDKPPETDRLVLLAMLGLLALLGALLHAAPDELWRRSDRFV